MTTQTISLKDHRDWRATGLPGDVIYIGRPCHMGGWRLAGHALANPYRVGPDFSVADVLAAYAAHLASDPNLLAAARALAGKTLACFCPNGQPCHTWIAAAYADDDPARVFEIHLQAQMYPMELSS